jgi:alkanesulfonate monooxygenase SsuD/methylene tetrahydromethanopterin reductase-like flavin-dependent oxidoreductase (luciferase family)
MRTGFILPGGSATRQLEQAVAAEAAGWDAVVLWEAAYGVDPWSLLAAVAARTERVRLGTILTPAPWRRPWKLASQVATVDQVSGGRAFVTLGLGALADDLPQTGEITDRVERARRLDETIDVMRALWAGEHEYHGEVYDVVCPDWLLDAARPVQRPIPVWVAAAWPRPRSMRRAARCDGVVPEYHLDGRDEGPDETREARAWLRDHGARDDLDMVAEGETPADDRDAAAAQVAPWAEAGCTWWMETRWGPAGDVDDRLTLVDERIAAGPPGAART